MRIENVTLKMWLWKCDFALWDGITWLTSGLISFTASCCYGNSKKPEQSLSSKYFCIIILHDCVPKQQASSSESNDRIYCVSFARGASNLCYILKWLGLYSVASPIFIVIFSATVYQEVTILFSLTWMETVIYLNMFYAIFQFCA